ncbi:MAG TPA: DUF998 domain-containing protein, partial [Galbitalea sp.]|nr:DUF998 domain-containing protein [Galbitalea sp.]
MIRNIRSITAGSLALVLAGVVYLVTEAIAASGWSNPRYSYASNYVSDLGVTGPQETFLGHNIYSPLATVMNTGFVLNGVLALLGVLLMVRFGSRARSKAFWILAILFAVGMTLVGTFHGSLLSEKAGTLAFHFVGAPIAIVSGNLIAILIGLSYREFGVGSWFRVLLLVLGIGGTLALGAEILVIGGDPSFPAGVFERVAVYTVLVSQLV